MNRDGLFPGSDGNVYAGRLPALVTYTLECSRCKAETSIMYRLSPGGCLMWPTILDGWQWLGDQLICPKHRVRVEDMEPPRKRVVWTCPHCHQYRWEGSEPPRECPACGNRRCCQWDKEETSNATT